MPFGEFSKWVEDQANILRRESFLKPNTASVEKVSPKPNHGTYATQGQNYALGPSGGSNTGNNSNNQKPPSNVPAGGTNRTSEKYGLPRPPTRCPVCNQGEPHFLASCDMFQSYHNEDMWKIIDKEGVCQFCLKNDVYHKWNECSEKRAKCSKCKWYHHAVLGCRPPRADGGPKNTGRG